jgi:hypothetical protein
VEDDGHALLIERQDLGLSVLSLALVVALRNEKGLWQHLLLFHATKLNESKSFSTYGRLAMFI